MFENTPKFWNDFWSRSHDRYNRHHKAIYEAVLPVLTGNVVDLGCGPCVMYQGTQTPLIGIDQSIEGLKKARMNYPPGVYIQALAHDTGLPSHQFDTVLMLGLLDYYKDWHDISTEAHRLSRGRIFATLLDKGFNGDWTREKAEQCLGAPLKDYKKLVGNWILIEL